MAFICKAGALHKSVNHQTDKADFDVGSPKVYTSSGQDATNSNESVDFKSTNGPQRHYILKVQQGSSAESYSKKVDMSRVNMDPQEFLNETDVKNSRITFTHLQFQNHVYPPPSSIYPSPVQSYPPPSSTYPAPGQTNPYSPPSLAYPLPSPTYHSQYPTYPLPYPPPYQTPYPTYPPPLPSYPAQSESYNPYPPQSSVYSPQDSFHYFDSPYPSAFGKSSDPQRNKQSLYDHAVATNPYYPLSDFSSIFADLNNYPEYQDNLNAPLPYHPNSSVETNASLVTPAIAISSAVSSITPAVAISSMVTSINPAVAISTMVSSITPAVTISSVVSSVTPAVTISSVVSSISPTSFVADTFSTPATAISSIEQSPSKKLKVKTSDKGDSITKKSKLSSGRKRKIQAFASTSSDKENNPAAEKKEKSIPAVVKQQLSAPSKVKPDNARIESDLVIKQEPGEGELKIGDPVVFKKKFPGRISEEPTDLNINLKCPGNKANYYCILFFGIISICGA